MVLTRSIVAALKPSPVLLNRWGAWTAPNDMVLLPTAQARLLARTIQAPAPAILKRPKLLEALRVRDRLTGQDLVDFAAHLVAEPEKAGMFESLLEANPQLLTAVTVRQLRDIPFLITRAGDLAAPRDLFLDNEVNRICAASDSRIVGGRNPNLYVRLRCQERPSVVVMLKALEELKAEDRAPTHVVTFYAALVQALRAERTPIAQLIDRPILWCQGAYCSPRDALVGPRIPNWFQRAVPYLRGPSILADSFEALGAATSPQDHHWIRFFEWAGEQTNNTFTVGPDVRQILRDAYQRRGFSGLPDGLPENVRCLLAQDNRLFSRAEVRAGALAEDDFPALATALSKAGATTGFAATTDDSRSFFGALGLQRLTTISGSPKLSVGQESKAPPWFKARHAERILELLQREDFRTAIDLLVYGYRREHGTICFFHQHEIMDRLRSIEHVRFVTGIDRHYTLGGKTVGITTEAAAVDGDIALKPTRTKFEYEQNLTYALAELLGATQVSDARRLSLALLPLLMCESSADMFAYLERQGLKPSSWTESALPAVDPIVEADAPPSPEQTVIQTLLTQMFDQAATAGPDNAPAPAAVPTAASTPPPPPARTTFELPSLDLVTPSIERPTDHALAARPPAPSGGGWYTSGSSNWRPPDAYDIDRDQKVGARGEEIVYLAELERVRAFGHERPEEQVIWVSKTQPGADHDIRSIDEHGNPLWLEVKSSMGTDGRFDWPQREFEKALRERDRYILWRVYEAHTAHPVAKAFVNPAALLARSMLRVELSGMVGFVESR